MGIEAFTPRTYLYRALAEMIGLAFTQSFEYRFVRTPVESLPPLQRDMTLESFDSFTQLDLKISEKQTATLSLAMFPQKLDYLGPEYLYSAARHPKPTPAGIQGSAQHRYVTESVVCSLRKFDLRALRRRTYCQTARSIPTAGRNDRRRILRPAESRTRIESNGRRFISRVRSTSSAYIN